MSLTRKSPCRGCGTRQRADFRHINMPACRACCPEPLRWCCHCNTARPGDGFASTGSYCKGCEADRARARRIREPKAARSRTHAWLKRTRAIANSPQNAKQTVRVVQLRAIKRGIEFSDDPQFREDLVRRIIAGRCELTGIPFSKDGPGRHLRAFTPSLDRIVPDRGYVPGNVRVVIWAVNAAIGSWGLETALKVSRALVAIDDTGAALLAA